eukprot:scaffold3511_cov144-Skeletonema_dohrnii-CCMP3373.AAC.3
MEYSSTKKQRLPGISFMMDNSSSSDDDEDDDNSNYNIRRGSGITANLSHDVTMNSDTNYYRCDPIESPLITHNEENDCNDTVNESDATMESPINAMASYNSAAYRSASKTTTTNNNNTQLSAVVAAPSPFFSPTTNALNQSLLQHAESLVDITTDTPLERVENGVLNVVERLGSAFSSVKKRTLGDVQRFSIQEEEEEERGEQTVVLDVAAAYMARLARDGLYDDDDKNDEVGHSSPCLDNEGVRVNESGQEENKTAVPHSPPLIAVEEEEADGDSIHDESSLEESIIATVEDTCYHEDSNNIDDDDDEEDDLSYYICNTAGFCSSESINDSSISETASEEEEEDDDEFYGENEYDDTIDDKSCSLDLTGIEKIMNLDDTLPSVIPKVQLCRSNSDVDLSGIDGVMNLDDTLPLEDHCDDDDDEEEEDANETGNLMNGDTVQAEPSIHDNEDGKDGFVPSSHGDNKNGDDDLLPSSYGDTVQDEPSLQVNDCNLQGEASLQDNEEGDDDFVPSALKEMISEQESQFSSLLGSISNMQSTPGRIKRLEASLMGEEDEDADLNGIVDMTNAEIGLTPVKRRLELVAEEELKIESAGKARMTRNALFKSGLEPELEEGDLQESVTPPCNLPESEAEVDATPFKPSMELEVDGEQEDVASPDSVITADSSETSYKSPWLSFISRQSPLSQPQEAAPTPPIVHEEEVDAQDIQEATSNLTSSSEVQAPEPIQKSDQITPIENSESIVENDVPDSILQMFADADDALQNVMDSSIFEMNASPEEKEVSESGDNDIDCIDSLELELREGAVSGNDVDEPTSQMSELEKVEVPTKSDEVEFNESDQMSDSFSEEKQITSMQKNINSDEATEPEPLDHSASSQAIGSVIKTTENFQVAEPSLTGEEPTLECLRGAFLAAESKLEAESSVPASKTPESHDTNEEEHFGSVSSDNKSVSSVVNDTFETANFSLGEIDIDKTVIEHFFFDAEDDMKGVDGDSVQTASECNSDTATKVEDGILSASFEKTLSSDNIEPSEEGFAEKDFVKLSGGNHVKKLDKLTEDVATTSASANDLADTTHDVKGIAKGDSPNSASVETALNESMFMPNASMEVASPPLIVEESLPAGVAVAHITTPEEEYESEDGDDDEDFFPNRDLRPSSNVQKESAQATTASTVAEQNSKPISITSSKQDVKNLITGSQKEPTSRLPKLPNMQTGSTSSASSKHRNRLSTSATLRKSAPSAQNNPTSTSSKDGKSQREKDSASQTRLPRARIRAKKGAIPIEGKENNQAEHNSKDNSIGASKKSSYSVERLERLSKPRRQSMIPEPSPVKQRDFKKVASIDRLSRLAQPRRQSVVPTSSPISPVQKKAHQKASIDRLSQLAQPKRQSFIPTPSPKKKEHQKVAAGTPSFVRRSKLLSSSKPTSKSTEEIEQEEMSQFKPFKAKPLNGREVPSRFKAVDRKPPRISVAPAAHVTKPRPPAAVKAPSSRLYQPSPRRHKVMTFGESQQSYLNNGLRSQPPLPNVSTKLTTPKPFALSTKTNIMSKPPPASSDEIELQKKFKALPYPGPRRQTMSFSQPKSSEELELEECRKQFKALPLPASVSTTRINYTDIPYHIKAQQQHEMAMERKQRIVDESQETVSFKARPVPRTTYEARKIQRQSTSSVARTVAPRPPRLSLASRAEERKLFDDHARLLREQDTQVKENILRQQKEWEEEELKQKRMTTAEEGGMCFKAREIHIEYM